MVYLKKLKVTLIQHSLEGSSRYMGWGVGFKADEGARDFVAWGDPGSEEQADI